MQKTKLITSFIVNGRAAAFLDFSMIPIAWMLSYWLRFNLNVIPEYFLQASLHYLVILMPVQVTFFFLFGLYRGAWRFSSIPDLMRILQGSALGVVVSTVLLFILYRLEGVPRSIPLLYWLLLVILLSTPRLLYRWISDRRGILEEGKRILIVGAGDAGEMLARDLLRARKTQYIPVAFVDDKDDWQGRDIHGVPVKGRSIDIPELTKRLSIDVIVLAVPSASAKERKRLIELCEKTGVQFRTVPLLESLVSGQVAINQLREVSIEDLLGREPVKLDWNSIRAGLSNRTILVTGAGGSIGSELCQQLARLEPGRLILAENSEFNLYSIELELRRTFPDLVLEAYLADIRDEAAIDHLFKRTCPSVVFHAAAYKHVPMLESQVREAVHSNVIGTKIIADAADRYGATDFLLISTDKAVNPANVMGTTKRISELYCQNLNAHSKTRYVTVRFGNVLGSAGSVVPLFKQQIEAGGPVTVTHKDMERFFMTIPEACQLIMQSTVQGNGGEIFVLDMGEPVRIGYLAEQMIRLSGLIPSEDIEVSYTGLRPGEKLFEELFHEQEALQATPHEKILLATHRQVDWGKLCNTLDEMRVAVSEFNEVFLHNAINQLVPERKAL